MISYTCSTLLVTVNNLVTTCYLLVTTSYWQWSESDGNRSYKTKELYFTTCGKILKMSDYRL